MLLFTKQPIQIPCPVRAPPQAKEGIKRKIVKGGNPSEVFDAVVSVQRELIQFHERKAGMQLLMDRSLAVLAQMRKEQIQVMHVYVGEQRALRYLQPW